MIYVIFSPKVELGKMLKALRILSLDNLSQNLITLDTEIVEYKLPFFKEIIKSARDCKLQFKIDKSIESFEFRLNLIILALSDDIALVDIKNDSGANLKFSLCFQ